MYINLVALTTLLTLSSTYASDLGFVSVGSGTTAANNAVISPGASTPSISQHSVSGVASSNYIVNSVDGTNTNFAFAVNVPSTSNDLYFRLSGPSSKAWVAVGTGTLMDGSMMFVAYPSANGINVTLSARVCSGHNEPTYDSSIHLTLLPGSGVINDSIVANAKCSNCTSWSGGKLNLQSTSEPWNWAIGPGFQTWSDDPTATVFEHDQFGTFALDMSAATSDTGGVPSAPLTNAGSQTLTGAKTDPKSATVAHGLITAAAFVLIMPGGVLSLVVFGKMRIHWIMQTIGFVAAIIGGGLGLYLSRTYNFTKGMGTGHQIIGLLVTIALLAQVFLGGYHHWMFKRTLKATPFGKIHKYLGHPIILAGMINGVLGFDLMHSTTMKVAYTAIMAVVTVALIAGVVYAFWRKRKNEDRAVKETNAFGSDWISQPSRAYVTPSSATNAYRMNNV